MAKKKNQTKKHRFKYAAAPSESGITTEATIAQPGLKPVTASARVNLDSDRDFAYVASDLKRITVLAVALILLEVGLAYAFNHTGLGATVDNLIKL